MKKNVLIFAMIFLVIIVCTIFISDGLIYLISSLMAIAIMGTIYLNRSWALKITRWAKANPRKTQLLITVLQIVLMVLGVFAGNNFKESGYEFSETSGYVFSAITIIGFLSVNFLPKLRTIAIPKEVNRQRFAFMCIALSSFIMMVIFGNRLDDRYPNSPLTHLVKAIDQAIFQENSTEYEGTYDTALEPQYSHNKDQAMSTETSSMVVFASYVVNDNETIILPPVSKKETKSSLKAEKKAKKFEKKKTKLMKLLGKKRMSLAAGLTTGAVLLIILLVLAACTGACLVVGGVALLIDGDLLGLLAIVGGLGIGYLSIKGIGNVSKKDREKQMAEPKANQKTDSKL